MNSQQFAILSPMKNIQKPSQFNSNLYNYFDDIAYQTIKQRNTSIKCPHNIDKKKKHVQKAERLLPDDFFLKNWDPPQIEEFSGLKMPKRRVINIQSHMDMTEMRNIQIRRENFSQSTEATNICLQSWIKFNNSLPLQQDIEEDRVPDWVLRQKVGQRKKKLSLDEIDK